MKLLILCTGNSCRSIIAEAIVKKRLPYISVTSAGSAPKKEINPHAKTLLQNKGYNTKELKPATISSLENSHFDLVITVCDNANKACPHYPNCTKQIHLPFEDPDGKEMRYFEKCYNDIETILIPKVSKLLPKS